MPYGTPSWPLGFGGTLSQGARAYGDFSSFNDGDARGGGRPNGWFVGGERGGLGLSMNATNPGGAFGSSYYEGVQFGYKFQNAGSPLTVYAGFDTLKYNTGIGGPLTPFDSTTSTLPGGYRAHAGVEFQPAPNLSLSFGVGYAQQSGRIDSDINSTLLPGASPFAFGGRR